MLAKKHSLFLMYAASGNTSSTAALIAEATAQSPPVTIVTKWDLLSGPDLELLDHLRWDQQALVDFLVLLRSSFFAGVDRSSFSWNVAAKRHVTSENGTCGPDTDELPDGLAFRDEFSEIVGNNHEDLEVKYGLEPRSKANHTALACLNLL